MQQVDSNARRTASSVVRSTGLMEHDEARHPWLVRCVRVRGLGLGFSPRASALVPSHASLLSSGRSMEATDGMIEKEETEEQTTEEVTTADER